MARRQWIPTFIVGCFFSSSLLVAPVTLAAQPASPVGSPISAACDVGTNRTLDEFRTLIVTGLAEGAARMAVTPAATPAATALAPEAAAGTALPADSPADVATTAAVTETIATYHACLNAGRFPMAWNYLPDSWVSRQIAALVYTFARGAAGGEEIDPVGIEPRFIDSALNLIYYSETPPPPAQQLRLLAVNEVRDLGGGLVQAEFTTSTGDNAPETVTLKLQVAGDGYVFVDPLLDAAASAPPATPMP